MKLKNVWPPFEVSTHILKWNMSYVYLYTGHILYIFISIDIFVYLSKYVLLLLHCYIIIVRINIHNDATRHIKMTTMVMMAHRQSGHTSSLPSNLKALSHEQKKPRSLTFHEILVG